MESKQWERFKTETKNQFMVFLKASKYGDATKHVLSDALDGIDDHALDVIATLRIIRASNNKREIAVAGMLAFLWEFEGSYATCARANVEVLVVP